jgi:hypothetical protein
MSSIRALTDAAAEAVNLFHRFLGPVADSPDPRATVVLSDALREYVSTGPYGPCADGVGPAQIAAAERWPSPGAMECAINDTIRLCSASGLRHGEGVNLAPIAFRAFTDLLLERERLINPSRLRGLHHAAVHEAKTWNTSTPLVIERIDAVVEQMKTLARLQADLDQKQWSPIYHAARHAIDQLRPFEQRDTPTTPDHLQIARYMEAARVTYELCEKARKIPPTPVPPIPEGQNSIAWFPDGERSVLLNCEPTVGPLLTLRNKAARDALLWDTLAPTVEAHIHALWARTQSLICIAMDSDRPLDEWAVAFEDWCRAFDRLTPFSGMPPGAQPAEAAPAPLAAVSASAKPRLPAPMPAPHPDDEILALWQNFQRKPNPDDERRLKIDFYNQELRGRTKLTFTAVKEAIRAAQRRHARAKKKVRKRR